MKLISVTLLVLKLLRSSVVKDGQYQNIPRILVTLLVLKLPRTREVKREQPENIKPI